MSGQTASRPNFRSSKSAEPPTGSMHCIFCASLDGKTTTAIVQTEVTNDRTGVRFNAFVCERCLTLGRITRVTCRTFKR